MNVLGFAESPPGNQVMDSTAEDKQAENVTTRFKKQNKMMFFPINEWKLESLIYILGEGR